MKTSMNYLSGAENLPRGETEVLKVFRTDGAKVLLPKNGKIDEIGKRAKQSAREFAAVMKGRKI